MARFKETRGMIDESSPVVLTVLVWFVVVAVVAGVVGLGVYSFSAPTRVAIDNMVFHNSQAYNDGMARDLDNFKLAYAQADQAGKTSIRASVQHRFAGYDAGSLPPDLQTFLTEMRQ